MKAAIAASTELQERDALKMVSLSAAMTEALLARGVPGTLAAVACELGLLAFKRGYAAWAENPVGDDLATHVRAAFAEIRAATAALA